MRRFSRQLACLLGENGGRLVTAVEERGAGAAAGCLVPAPTACYHSQPPAHPLTPAYYDPSEFKSRKPSIKRPSLHQWHFCNAGYDPMAPVNKADWQAQEALSTTPAIPSSSQGEAEQQQPEPTEHTEEAGPSSPAADSQQEQQQQHEAEAGQLSPQQQAAAVVSALPQLAPNSRGQAPVVGQMLPPFAPLAAHFKDYHQTMYHDQLPRFHRKRHRYHMRKQQSLAQQRWRAAAEQRAAAAARLDAKVQRAAERQLRQAAWADWCRQQQQWQQQK